MHDRDCGYFSHLGGFLGATHAGSRILLVEDDKANQVLVPAILAKAADPLLRTTEVIIAGTLAEARAVLADGNVHVVLLDGLLPDGSGLSLAEELRQSAKDQPVVIALSGSLELAGDALAAGCAAVLSKPYQPAELCNLITDALRRRPGQVIKPPAT